jgi:hypothetical protein
VDYATGTTGTATPNVDYASTADRLNIPAGAISASTAVRVNGDGLAEANETFFVNLTNPANATIADPQGKATITNARPTISIDDVSVSEGNSGTTNAVFTVSRSFNYSVDSTVRFATANGTATTGNGDYVSQNVVLTIPVGSTTVTNAVVVNGDVVYEPDETFRVNLSAATNATILDSQGNGTILNDESAPAISINDVSISEGNSGTKVVTFTVSQTVASSTATTVDYATADGSATAPSDYTSKTGTVTILAGTTSKTFTVTIKGDGIEEPNENFVVNLSNAVNATIVDPQGSCTIQNDDVTPAISINDVSVVEGNSGTQTVTFTVSLSIASNASTSVNFATANGSAIAPSDYTSKTGTVTIAAGATSKTFTVTVKGDTAVEPNENFFVNLSNPVNATIADSQGMCTIINND